MNELHRWSRRDFLKTASAATLSALMAKYPRQLRADAEPVENKTQRRYPHRALDGWRDGSYGNVRSKALHPI